MADNEIPRTLDAALYERMEEPDLDFVRAQTGITDPEELKKHIMNVQAEIFAVRCQLNYP